MPDDDKATKAAMDNRLTLRAGQVELELSLDGGCITAFRWRRNGNAIDWMRPAPPGSGFAPTEAACFPLVPYSNRIRDGRFAFEGRTYQLARNFPPEEHSIHGHGWQSRWRAQSQNEDSVALVFDFPQDGGEDPWPTAYRAEQRFELSETTLAVEIAVTNTGDRNMPAGLGLHPYFVRTPACRLIAETGQMWESDAAMMPTRLVTPPAALDPSLGVEPSKASLDSCYAGFGGRAEIEWPEWGAKLIMQSEDSLGFLVVFTPPGEDFFCVEPVSAMTNAVNLAREGFQESGFRSLGPGERFAARTLYTPQLG